MIALTDDVYELWVNILRKLVAETSDRLVAQVSPTDPDGMWIRQLWPAGARTIDFATASGLCGQIGLVIPSQVAEKSAVSPAITIHTSTDKCQVPLDYTAFRSLVKGAQCRPEFAEIHRELASDGTLDRPKVGRFLRQTQRVSLICLKYAYDS